MSVSAYSVTVTSVEEELGCSRLLAIAGLSIFTLTFGAAPLVLAPLSEVGLHSTGMIVIRPYIDFL